MGANQPEIWRKIYTDYMQPAVFFWNTKYDQLVANEIEYLNKAGLTRRNEKGGKAQLARYKIKILGG